MYLKKNWPAQQNAREGSESEERDQCLLGNGRTLTNRPEGASAHVCSSTLYIRLHSSPAEDGDDETEDPPVYAVTVPGS